MLQDLKIQTKEGCSPVASVAKKTSPTPPTFGETLKSPTLGGGKKAAAVPLNLGAKKAEISESNDTPVDTFDVKSSSNQNIKIPDFLKRG